MPYLVTTKRPLISVSPFASRGSFERDALPVVSQRAVATLEEARRQVPCPFCGAEAGAICIDGSFTMSLGASHHARLPESGGSVGPLPGGTVIEVSQTTRAELLDAVRLEDLPRGPGRWTLGEILAAYNARGRA